MGQSWPPLQLPGPYEIVEEVLMKSPYFPERSIFFLLFQSASTSEEAAGYFFSWYSSSGHVCVWRIHFIGNHSFMPQPSSQPTPSPDAMKGTQIQPRNLSCFTSSSQASGTSRSWPTGQAKLVWRFCILGPFLTHIVKAEWHIPRSGHVSFRVTLICYKDTAAVWFFTRHPYFNFSFLTSERQGRCWVFVSPVAYPFCTHLG